MNRPLLERMIGGLILLLALVLIVPSILTGERRSMTADSEAPAGASLDLRTHTIRLGDDQEQPPVPQHVPPALTTLPEPEAAAVPEPRSAPPPALPAAPESAAVPEPAPVAPPAAPPAPARTTPPPASQPAAAQEGWVVQLGSFGREDNAGRLAAEVRAAGYEVWILPLKSDGGTLYRVRVGPVAQERSEAEQLARRLVQSGHRGQVVRQ